MVTFKKPIGSVSVSGHKFVGAPVPCGVVITRKEYVEALSSDVEYLNSRDATIMGSRNGHAPLYLWYTLTKKGYEGMRKDVEKCLRNAHLLKVSLVPCCLCLWHRVAFAFAYVEAISVGCVSLPCLYSTGLKHDLGMVLMLVSACSLCLRRLGSRLC